MNEYSSVFILRVTRGATVVMVVKHIGTRREYPTRHAFFLGACAVHARTLGPMFILTLARRMRQLAGSEISVQWYHVHIPYIHCLAADAYFNILAVTEELVQVRCHRQMTCVCVCTHTHTHTRSLSSSMDPSVLPADMVREIASHLRPLCRQRLAMTCRAWRDVLYVPGGIKLLAFMPRHWRSFFTMDPCWDYYTALIVRALTEAPPWLLKSPWELGTSKKIYHGPKGMVLSMSWFERETLCEHNYALSSRKGWQLKTFTFVDGKYVVTKEPLDF